MPKNKIWKNAQGWGNILQDAWCKHHSWFAMVVRYTENEFFKNDPKTCMQNLKE